MDTFSKINEGAISHNLTHLQYSIDSGYCYEGEWLYACITDFGGGCGGVQGMPCATSSEDVKAKEINALKN